MMHRRCRTQKCDNLYDNDISSCFARFSYLLGIENPSYVLLYHRRGFVICRFLQLMHMSSELQHRIRPMHKSTYQKFPRESFSLFIFRFSVDSGLLNK